MTTATAYDQALALAATHGRAFYVNRVPVTRDDEVLLAEKHRDRLCCAVAHPDGTLERVVQGYSHAVAMTFNPSNEITK